MTDSSNQTHAQRISAKQAVEAALGTCKEVTGHTDVKVEELEMDAERKHWLVTLAFVELPASHPSILYPDVPQKIFKVFTVDAATGEAVSMKDKPL